MKYLLHLFMRNLVIVSCIFVIGASHSAGKWMVSCALMILLAPVIYTCLAEDIWFAVCDRVCRTVRRNVAEATLVNQR